MAQCKDCIHNKVCRYQNKLAKIDEYNWYAFNKLDNVQDFCKYFIFAELNKKFVPDTNVGHKTESEPQND